MLFSRVISQPKCSQRHRQASTNTEQDGVSFHDSLNFVTTRESEASELIAEYLARTDRLVANRLFSRMGNCRTRPLPADIDLRLAYESPQNLALELSKSILYEDASSIDIKTLKSLNSHGDSKHYSEDSLWNGKPQQYFESMKSAIEGEEGTVIPTRLYENESLA